MMRRQTGFTLIELMVSMVIGSIIILGAGYLFLTAFKTFQKVDEISRKQEVLVFMASSMVTRIRSRQDGNSEYRLECVFESSKCICTIYDDSGVGNSQPLLNFDKQLDSDIDEPEEQCLESKDVGNVNGYLTEVELPLEMNGRPIRFNVANRAKVLSEYLVDGDDGSEEN